MLISDKHPFGIKRLFSRSISKDLTVCQVLIVLITATIVISVNYYLATVDAQKHLNQEADEYISYLAGSLEIPLWDLDNDSIFKLGQSYSANEIIAKLQITEFPGRVVFSIAKEDKADLITRKREIIHDGQIIGYIELGLTSRLYKESNRQLLWTNIFTILVVVISLSIAAGFLFRIFLKGPLGNLIVGINQIAQGDYEHKVPRAKQIEIKAILLQFDYMAQQIKGREHTLNEVNMQLENEITERKQAEEALRESEERYRAFFEQGPDGVVVLDPETARLIEFNDQACRQLGYSREEFARLQVTDIEAKETAQEAQAHIQKVLSKGYDDFETFQHTKQGEIRHVHVTAQLIKIAGRPVYHCIWRDITNRKRAEKAQFEALARFYGFADASQYGMGMADLDGHFVYVNSTLARMLGEKSPDDCLGKHFPTAYYSSLMTRKLQEEVMPAMMRDGHWHGELELLTMDHRCVPTDENYFVIRDENGKPCYLADILTDITERKQAEKALRESEKRYRLLVQHAPAGIHEIDMETMKFISVNDVMCEYTGYTRDEFLALDPWELISDESKETRDRLLEEVFAGNPNPAPVEYKIRGKNNREFWVLIHSRFSFENGVPKRATAVIHDLTVIRQAQEEKKQLEAQLHQAHKMEAIGTLAGGIAHDFNNILGIILGNTELAIDDIPTWNPARMNLEEIKTASLRAKDVVRQLLSFARKTKLEKKPINITPIVKESFKLLRSSIPTSIEIRQNIFTNIDTILADPTQINQVLINLCTNADHAMPDGGVIVVTLKNVNLDKDAAVQHPELQPGRYVNLTVSDTGHGISQEEIDRIFEPYYTTKEVGRGTGMGLAVVHGIVKEHNGLIVVESKVGKGTTFSIFFPVVEQEALVEIKNDENLPTGDERILFIDDEESIVKLGHQILERLGYKVEATISPIEALALFRSQPYQFDLVITDLTMPKMTGDKLVEEILNIRPDIPIILCTGFSEKIDAKKAKEIGAADYIEKPLDKRDFAFKVREVLDRK